LVKRTRLSNIEPIAVAVSGRRSESLKQETLTIGRYFFKGARIIGPFENPVTPQEPPYSGQGIGEGDVLFAAPLRDEQAFAIGLAARW
jgi:hypothetical protein